MELRRVILTKSKLLALPSKERSLLLLLGQASNEINVLSKLILMVMRKDESPSPIVDHVETGQLCVLLRVLAGKLHEAWELFKKRVLADRPLAKKYLPQLENHGATALNRLKKHFGRESLLTEIRNKIASHYTDKDNLTEQSFQSVADTEPLEFYLTEVVGNSFYHASEQVTMISALKMAVSKTGCNEAQAPSQLYWAVIDVSRDFADLFGDLIGAIAETCSFEIKSENVPDGPKLSTLSLPYFVDFDSVPRTADSHE
jgi:hypothetical protein